MMVKCKWCKIEIENNKNNFKNWCNRKCWRKEYYYRNRKTNIEKTRKWVLNNKEKVKAYKKELYRTSGKQKERILLSENDRRINKREYCRKYNQTPQRVKYNHDRRRLPEVRKYMREHWKKWAKKNKEQLRIRSRLQNRLHYYLKRIRLNPDYDIKEVARDKISLSSVAKYLLERLPEDFYKKNYHIDHIIPLCAFDLTKEEQLKEAFSLENHQWLLAIDNLKKQAEDKKQSIWKKK